MLADEKVNIKWTSSNKNYYVGLGYKFTRIKDEFTVEIVDLPKGSKTAVKVVCDYCGEQIEKAYYRYINARKKIEKDACSKCNFKKIEEINLNKYGVRNSMQRKDISDKSRKNRSRRNINDVAIEFKKRGYILLSKEYKSSHSKLDYICLNHEDKGVLSITYNNLVAKGSGCWYCGNENKINEHSSIVKYLRGRTFKWRNEVLSFYDNKCVITGEKENLDVHHLKPFLNIVLEIFEELNLPLYGNVSDYSKEEIDRMVELLYLKHDISNGVPILNKVHNQFHSEYGRINFSKEDFYEFKNNYIKEMERC